MTANQQLLTVIFFTLALFIAGCVLQQQTVRSIQNVIKPRIPSPRVLDAQTLGAADNQSQQPKGFFGWRHAASKAQLQAATINWNKLAYVQVVKRHEDVCSAIMLFGDLVRTKSPAQRVLLVPKSWFLNDAEEDNELAKTVRLLKKAARTFRVVLVPMDTLKEDQDEKSEKSYSIARAFGLLDYDKVILLKTPGSFVNAAPMDAILAFSNPATTVTSLVTRLEPEKLVYPLLIKPTSSEQTRLSSMLTSNKAATDDAVLLTSAYGDIPTLETLDYLKGFGKSYLSLISSSTDSLTHYLPERDAQSSDKISLKSFNVTFFKQEASFIRLWDASLPGPEYDVPYDTRALVRPKHSGARRIWERTYESFRARRQDVCGLELEPWTE